MNKSVLQAVIFIIISAIPVQTPAQEAKTDNIQVDIKENKVHIHYDIVNSVPVNDHRVDLLLLDQRFDYFDPGELSGDIGEGISGGDGKTIVWDAMADRFDFSRKVTPQIYLDWEKKGGPSNAFLSLLLPGLGDYFVADSREMTIKPWMRSLSALGFMTMGIIANSNRESVPLYTYSDVEYIDSETGDYIQDRENVIYGHKTDYWLFNSDAEVFLGVGAAIWIADILWVAIQGFKNEEVNRHLGNTHVGVNSHGMYLGYSIDL
jgi:hypothetical protein